MFTQLKGGAGRREGSRRRREKDRGGGQAGRTREGKKRKWEMGKGEETGQKGSVPAPQMGGIHGNKTFFSIEG